MSLELAVDLACPKCGAAFVIDMGDAKTGDAFRCVQCAHEEPYGSQFDALVELLPSVRIRMYDADLAHANAPGSYAAEFARARADGAEHAWSMSLALWASSFGTSKP